MQTIRVGDIGTIIRGTIYQTELSGCEEIAGDILDISTATTKEFIFRKPEGDPLTVSASFYTDGTDGILKYQIVSGDIDQEGRYEVVAHVVMPSGEWSSNIGSFYAEDV